MDGSQPAGSPVSSQPNTAVAGMTIQAARRSVIAGDLVLVPVWLVKGANVANLNLQLTYDANVIRPEGSVIKGNLLDNTLFTPNSAQSGIIRVAFAQTTGIAGTGTVVNVPFRAAGKPGDRSPVNLTVTSINDPNGGVPSIATISGEIVIVGTDGRVPGGSGPGASGPGASAIRAAAAELHQGRTTCRKAIATATER